MKAYQTKEKDIILASSYHMAEDEIYGDDDREYRISFRVNDAFKEAKSHASEVEMLHTYAPADEYGREGELPYLAIQIDDRVYDAVEEFKETGTFSGAMELTPLSGRFYFKAKMEYYGDVMYFYGLDRCDGFWEQEKKLMQVLDEAVGSYQEERKEGT